MGNKSLGNGNGANGQSGPGDPYYSSWRQGWNIRPYNFYELINPLTPQGRL
jgi:hypothetical protein